MRPFRLPFTLLAVVTFLNVVGLSAQAQGGPTPTPWPEVPPYGVRGPYAVGRSWFLLDKGSKQELLLIAWYPALKQPGDQTGAALVVPDEYQLIDTKAKALERVGKWGAATRNAVPDPSGAPYPLVIFSPGWGASALDYVYLEEHLASYGFMVLAPALPIDNGAYWESIIGRPMLTHRQIDFAEALNSQDGGLKGLVDTKHIGVAGHSSGGYTALAAAGAQFNFAWFEKWCTDRKDSPDTVDLCPAILDHEQEMLDLARLDSMPKALWPSWGDPRVTAIISQSGDAYIFGPSGLASVTIPVMVQVGSQDTINTPEWNAYLTYNNVSSIQKAQVVFEGGDHVIFQADSDRKSGGIPSHDLINHFTTAFLLDAFKGDKDAHKALLPDAVRFPDIEYKTTMK